MHAKRPIATVDELGEDSLDEASSDDEAARAAKRSRLSPLSSVASAERRVALDNAAELGAEDGRTERSDEEDEAAPVSTPATSPAHRLSPRSSISATDKVRLGSCITSPLSIIAIFRSFQRLDQARQGVSAIARRLMAGARRGREAGEGASESCAFAQSAVQAW